MGHTNTEVSGEEKHTSEEVGWAGRQAEKSRESQKSVGELGLGRRAAH